MEPNLFVNGFSLDRIMQLVYLQLFVCFLVGIQWLCLVWYKHKKSNRWRIVGEGVFEKILTKTAKITAERIEGSFRPVIDTVFFKNGDTCKAIGITQDLPVPGKRVRIFKNGFAEFKVEKVL